MKKTIITILTVIGAFALISFVLSKNKKDNQEKIDIVNQNNGAAVVQITTVAKAAMNMDYSANGNLIASREIDLKSENAGVVAAISVKEGDRVSKGQVLATLDNKFLALNQQTAQDAYQKLLTDKERYESSFQTGGVTQAQLDDINLRLKNAENQLKEIKRKNSDANIKAPFSGIINTKHIEIGDYLSPGTPLFEIVDVSEFKLKVSVDENQVSKLKLGDKVAIAIPVFPDKSYSGTICFIAPKADAALNFPVEILLGNESDNLIKAGMYATAIFESAGTQNAVFIPRKAFVGSVNSKEVYVLKNDSTVALRKVVPGAIIQGNVEILEGLNEGEQVVISGQINLTDGAKVVVQE